MVRFDRRFLGCALLLLWAAPSVYAVDGVVLIDQTRALAGGVTPGDTPGFPVTITQRGSYRLSGNLNVPDGNTTAIDVRADFVTIDLNGFSIIGPADCSGVGTCKGFGNGHGIVAGDIGSTPPRIYFNITIRNGTIQGMGYDGIFLFGDALVIENMTLRSNAGNGAQIYRSGPSIAQGGVIVRHNNMHLNGFAGIDVEMGLVTENTISQNRYGIRIPHGLIRQNVVTYNSIGLQFFGTAAYGDNAFWGNQQHVEPGGVNLGRNACDAALCP